MSKKQKHDSELDEEEQKRQEQRTAYGQLIDEMFLEFNSRYKPSATPEGCDLKTTTEITDVFSTIAPFEESLIAIYLNEQGFRIKLIGNEFRWMLKPQNTDRV